jgi:hypothetical protein
MAFDGSAEKRDFLRYVCIKNYVKIRFRPKVGFELSTPREAAADIAKKFAKMCNVCRLSVL